MSDLFSNLYDEVRSGIFQISFLDERDKRVGSGTAFFAHGFLITNFHVFISSESFRTVIKSGTEKKETNREYSFRRGELKRYLKQSSDENGYDYAALKLDDLDTSDVYRFSFQRPGLAMPGAQALLLGFPFNFSNLVMHQAMISSRIKSGVADVLLLDASVNPSNSGGPLLDPTTRRVLGIVTRRHTGISNQFDVLISSINESIAALQATRAGGGGVSIMGIDPIQGFEVVMRQIQGFAVELYRSANVGIGYAFEPTGIIEHLGIGAEV
jgi:S1-C subfamily serine protease